MLLEALDGVGNVGGSAAMKTRPIAAAFVFAVLLAGGAATAAAFSSSHGDGWLPFAATSQDEHVITALEDANHARAVAARTFDGEAIRAHYANDPTVPLSAAQVATLRRIVPGAAADGMLTYQLAYFEHWRAGAAAFQRVQAAYQAGTTPDPADVLAAIPPRVDPIRDLPMTVHAVRVSGDHAYVEAETEAQYFRVTLTLLAGRWYVVGENNTSKVGP